MKLQEITDYGQIEDNDPIVFSDHIGVIRTAHAFVLNGGEVTEEIVTNKKKNSYFIMNMYLNNESWVKKCYKVIE